MASEKQVAANQENAQHSTGPRDTRRTRRNAKKHGLTAGMETTLSEAISSKTLPNLMAQYRPVGLPEEWLTTQLAVLMMRIQRAVELERLYIAERVQENTVLRGPLMEFLEMEARTLKKRKRATPCPLIPQDIEKLNNSLGRYETSLLNRFFKILHELERLQRMRKGENVPPPAAGDLGIHVDDGSSPPDVPTAADEPRPLMPSDFDVQDL